MSIKVIYSSHAVDPQRVENENLPFFMGAMLPDHLTVIIQKVYLASIVRMQEALTKSMVKSLNLYTQTGTFLFDELDAVDIKGEIERCRLIMQNTLPPDEYRLLEVDSIRAVLEDLIIIVRKQVMGCFANTFNSINDDIGVVMKENAHITSRCILTFANVLTKNRREIN